jgi:hypothetical protein
MKTAGINKMKVRCSSMGMPQAEPILKEYFMNKHGCKLAF